MISVENEKVQFAANMTHDLLNPLSGIRLTAELLQKKLTDLNDQRLAKNIVTAANHLLKMVDHVLKMSRETDKELKICTFSLRELVSEVIGTVAITAEVKNIALNIDLPQDYIVTTDRNRCFRVLLNLVENAIKYTPKGHILIRSTCQNNVIRLDVEDTGIGISKEKQASIFCCYTQLEAGLLGSEGIGLGLHLVLLFAEQMGGKITVESKKNKGSTFSFSFKSLTNCKVN